MITLGDALKEHLRQKIGEIIDDEVRKRIIEMLKNKNT